MLTSPRPSSLDLSLTGNDLIVLAVFAAPAAIMLLRSPVARTFQIGCQASAAGPRR